MTVQVSGPYETPIAAGYEGSAVVTFDTPNIVQGILLAVYVKYVFADAYSSGGVLDVAIQTQGLDPSPPAQPILSLNSAGTDGWFYPSPQIHDTDGALISGHYVFGVPVQDHVEIVIENAWPGDSVEVWFILAE